MGYGYQPAYQKQLDGHPCESNDCGVVSTSMGIDMVSKGAKKPGHENLRDRMGIGNGGSNMWDIERGILTYDSPDELGNKWKKLKCRRETDGGSDGTWDTVTHHLPQQNGHNNSQGVIIGVDYGMLRRSNPNKTGSSSFDGWHSILLTAWDKRDGKWQVRVYDPLNDGRGNEPGPGPVWIQAHDVKVAAWSYGKAVHGKSERVACVFLLDPVPVDDEPPPDPPPDPCAEAAQAVSVAAADLHDLAEGAPPGVRSSLRAFAAELHDAIADPTADPDAEPTDGLGTTPAEE